MRHVAPLPHYSLNSDTLLPLGLFGDEDDASRANSGISIIMMNSLGEPNTLCILPRISCSMCLGIWFFGSSIMRPCNSVEACLMSSLCIAVLFWKLRTMLGA